MSTPVASLERDMSRYQPPLTLTTRMLALVAGMLGD
ncbi:hypothetical protein SAMN04490185_3020 [Pseudomonas frederiksbergensis]|uniref:Uncharacterized protein n=1 Tax=Pseudomonas frederiksbergensis TaxID=104087 RepID=A0A1H4YUZ5_9PSED|nr:hypothetical protein SAMN04490185_3020 [Pseudomonas frederiksbergensis]